MGQLITWAYKIPPILISNPQVIGQDRYDIVATADGPAKTEQMRIMMQSLLAERFKLSLHRENRAIPGYRLVLAKGGLKARPSPPDRGSTGSSRRGSLDAQGYTMAQVAFRLSEVLQHPVLDATHITGKFDFKLEWAPDELQARPPSGDTRPGSASDASPSIFAALQEQLGLKLESGKVSAEVLVIDSAEKPSIDGN